jgi:2-polyprenyl-3-methyl-5-hydroxy-6-metoxy-1,4-benzoquinol methylase
MVGPMTAAENRAQSGPDNAGAFTNRLLDVFNDAGVALLISIGHQTGLFDILATLPPSTSPEIAAAAELNERYVREWLSGVAAAEIIEYESDTGKFALPAHHASALTRAAGVNNVGKIAQLFSIIGEVEPKVVRCFREGGGVPYSDFPRFHAVRAEESGAVVDASLLDTILPLMDELPRLLQSGLDVADLGCGSGHAVNVMAKAYPASRFTGFDFAEAAINAARQEAAEMGVERNAAFAIQDLGSLNLVEAFDLVTVFDAIHDQAQPARVLENIYRALRPGGLLLMVDIKASSRLEENFSLPWAPLYYTTSMMHCMTVSLADGGAGLGSMWGHQLATSMLAEAGFARVEVREVETDPFNNYYIATK